MNLVSPLSSSTCNRQVELTLHFVCSLTTCFTDCKDSPRCKNDLSDQAIQQTLTKQAATVTNQNSAQQQPIPDTVHAWMLQVGG